MTPKPEPIPTRCPRCKGTGRMNTWSGRVRCVYCFGTSWSYGRVPRSLRIGVAVGNIIGVALVGVAVWFFLAWGISGTPLGWRAALTAVACAASALGRWMREPNYTGRLP